MSVLRSRMSLLSTLTPGDNSGRLRADIRVAIGGGLVATVVMSALVLAVGNLSAVEAVRLLEASLPTTRFLCSSVMAASATTLALMLTLLSLSTGIDGEIKGTHYERIRQIALVDVVAFIGATLLLVALVVPIGEASEIPARWYDTLYYASALMASVLGGMLVSVMLLLYAAVRDLISVFGPGDENALLAERDAAREERATGA